MKTKKKKLMQPLLGLGFSLIMLISTMLLSSCDPEREHVVEWSFHNQLEHEVDLHLYIDSSVLTNKVSNFVSIPPGDSAVLYTSRITDTGAVGSGYFYTEVDSVMVNFADKKDTIAVWRNGKQPTYGTGYEGLYDFYDDSIWDNVKSLLQHEENHIQYRYFLTLEEGFLPFVY